MKTLPIGISSFDKIRTDDYYYMDKTNFVEKLGKGGYYFLSRPRRFGNHYADIQKKNFLMSLEID